MTKQGLPLAQILFLDVSRTFDTPQRQILALATALMREAPSAPVLCCPEDTLLAASARLRGLTVLALPAQNPTGWHALLRLWWLWWRQWQDVPLLLHSFCTDSLRLAAQLVRLRRKASVRRIHSVFDPPPVLNAQNPIWQELDHCLCASVLTRNTLLKEELPATRLTLVRPGLDTNTLPQSATRALTHGRFVFVALASLEISSGLDVLIRAMSALWQRDDLAAWEVRIVGEGSRFHALLEEARALGVDGRLSLLNVQAPETVLPWADAVLAPSVDVYGTMPALQWAWAAGLPLICSDVPAHCELVRDKRNALVVKAGDPQELAAAMICLMRFENVRERLQRAGRAMRTCFTQDRAVRRICRAYALDLGDTMGQS